MYPIKPSGKAGLAQPDPNNSRIGLVAIQERGLDMNPPFDEIKIVDLDVERTRPSQKASGLRHMFLKLSALPDRNWIKIFEGERSFPRHTMWRHAWIENQHIVVDCVPEEIEQYHLKDLKQDVANTNTKYIIYLQRVVAENERQQIAKAAEKEKLGKLKDNLKFD